MATVLITGGTGLVGTALTKALLQKGFNVTILTRDKEKAKPTAGVAYAEWDPEKQIIDEDAVAAADFIVNLAGANVAEKRWSEARKREILNSRVQAGDLLSKTLLKTANNLKAFVSASAIGWYGPDLFIPNPQPFKEDAPHSNDYLGNTCYEWEQSVQPVKEAGKRLAILRTGIVLSNRGGALTEFKKPLKFGIATIMGGGKQIISWIHIDDLVQMYLNAIEQETYKGVYNAVAPAPVSNAELVTALAKKMKGKFYSTFAVPAFVLKIMLGEMSIEVLKSATVSAEKILQNGFSFRYLTIDAALDDLVRNGD